jgi:hypothetical protein
MKSYQTEKQAVLAEFDEGVKIQKNGGDPYWPDWDAVRNHFSTAADRLARALVEEIVPPASTVMVTDDPIHTEAFNNCRAETFRRAQEALGDNKQSV